MICISINQESRRLALVDMYNSAKQCDLLEIRLDRFGMAPELSEILARKPTPVIMSCRRKQDGGTWDGSEAERLALLRQCVASKADYVEIELDVAEQVKRLPPTRRVIAYTVRPTDSTQDILDRYTEAQTCEPDVIKLTTLARTPEEAWPLVQILAKPPVPTVVVGLGKPGVMLTVLGKKINAPWTYAALEKGMEAYPGQPTVNELRQVYHYDQISRSTRLIGVTGFGEREYGTVAGLNAALAHLELPARCLPLAVGSARLFRKVIDAVNLASVVVDAAHQEMLAEIANQQHPSASFAGLVDVLLKKDEEWTGYFTYAQGAVAALEDVLKARSEADDPVAGRMVVIVGINPVARSIAADLIHRKASVILASRKRKAVQELAQELGCRHIGLEAIYSTLHDTLIICDEEKEENSKGKLEGLHPGSLKAGASVMDLTANLKSSPFLREAHQRGCLVIEPWLVLLCQLDLQAKMITGKQVPREVIAQALPALEEE